MPANARQRAGAAFESHPEFPLERVCVHLYEPYQLKFARHAEHLLNVACDVQAEVGHHGLTLRGETESELELAATILRNFYGSQIRVGPVAVRYHRSRVLEEPFMGVRVRCDAARMEAVTADLVARGAIIVSSELVRGVALVRAVGPLGRLIGYAKALPLLGGESARQLMWLSHYAPVQELDMELDAGVPNCSPEEDTQKSDVVHQYDVASDDHMFPSLRGRLMGPKPCWRGSVGHGSSSAQSGHSQPRRLNQR
jgi:hypothetical protein